MNNRSVRLLGDLVIVQEVQPLYFDKIIEWRNNPEFNKFLNQPYKLTMELQKKWYKKYLNDFTQGLFVVIDKRTNKAFATIGYTNFDAKEKRLISGRLLVGEVEYRGSKEWEEGVKLVYDYFKNSLGINVLYAHVVIENFASVKWHNKRGFIKNTSEVKYPEELTVNGMQQEEYLMYLK